MASTKELKEQLDKQLNEVNKKLSSFKTESYTFTLDECYLFIITHHSAYRLRREAFKPLSNALNFLISIGEV